ncbi:transcription factor YY2 [Octopus vulgaris]|uniref:Transcription factor YY2 n=1 Tax=Octopus vulgaris TaxID=6645 RepID=A0AA36F563_OCTVU|nr:transcription factor YY2 [Octopus vulgaris]
MVRHPCIIVIRRHIEKLCDCNIWSKVFKSNSSLKMHKNIHTREKPFRHDVCGKDFKTFTRTAALAKQNIIHNGEKPYQCEIW